MQTRRDGHWDVYFSCRRVFIPLPETSFPRGRADRRDVVLGGLASRRRYRRHRLGLYYRAVAENGETGFYKATVTGRYFVGTSLLFLALFSQHANLALFAVGLVNFLGAFAMKMSLEFAKRTKTTTITTRNNKNNTNNNNSWANPSI